MSETQSDPSVAPTYPDVPRVSYAQNGEDILLDRIFEGAVGRYVDIGANHPFIDSNTCFFHLRGWRGVNLEPSPENYELFLKYRPDDMNLAVAASDHDGELTFYEVSDVLGRNGCSTLSAEVARHHESEGCVVREHTVQVRTVAALIEEHRIAPPDLLTIDVECHEDAVIRGIPLDFWRPKVIVVESVLPLSHAASHRSWEPRLIEHGYLFGTFNGVNRFYLRDDLALKLPRLRTPLSVLDRFETYEVDSLRRRVIELTETLQQIHAASRVA
jgi:FkbM family methyltransferase